MRAMLRRVAESRLAWVAVVLVPLVFIATILFVINTLQLSGDVETIQEGIAQRCVQGDDAACDRLRDRLFETADREEKKEFIEKLRDASEGGDASGSTGQPGGGLPGPGEGPATVIDLPPVDLPPVGPVDVGPLDPPPVDLPPVTVRP